MDTTDRRARRMWRALEPVHAVTYFAPESQEGCAALGTRGYWMSYFGQRAAPLGAAPPEVAAAICYVFHPAMVARAVPDVWRCAPPERFLEVRLAAVDAALHRLLGADVLASPEVAEAAALAREAALAAPAAGRPLGAANAALPWPEPAHLVLWHAQTVLRELRGDGHVAALLAAGLAPAEALVLFTADQGLDADWIRQRRGWSEQEWAQAGAALRDRGLLDGGAGPTAAGRALRAEVEERTDALAAAPWDALGEERSERLVELVTPLVAAILDGGGFPAVNPMALRPLSPR